MKIPVAKPYLDHQEAQSAYDTILTNWVTQGLEYRILKRNLLPIPVPNMPLLFLIALQPCIWL